MKFIELTSANNGAKINFRVEKIVSLVDHTQAVGDTIETNAFLWLDGMQEPFGVKEPTETIIERMKELMS